MTEIIDEIKEEYREAVRQYLTHTRTNLRTRDLYEGRMVGLEAALSLLGLNIDKIREMYDICEEELLNLAANEDIGPGDVQYDDEGFDRCDEEKVSQ